jgi:predicted transcriptional regulator
MKRCVVGIRGHGQHEPTRKGSHEPTVWFTSMASLAAVLSDGNRALLRTIREKRPRSLTELSELTGRKVPNLSRTLRMLSGYGLVELHRNVRDVQPIALATDFLVVLDSQGEGKK